jgi:hypothetical protein
LGSTQILSCNRILHNKHKHNGCDITSEINHNIPYLSAGLEVLCWEMLPGSVSTKVAVYTAEMNYIKIFNIKRQKT